MRFPLRVSLAVVISFLVIALSFTSYVNTSSLTENSAQKSAVKLFQANSENVKNRIHQLVNLSLDNVEFLSTGIDIPGTIPAVSSLKELDLFFKLLDLNTPYYSAYLGRDDGSFLQVISVRGNQAISKKHSAPDGTSWIVRSISENSQKTREQHWAYLDANKNILKTTTDPEVSYDPRQRPWYQQAEKVQKPVVSDVYVFNSLQQPGLTASFRSAQNEGVFGIDIRLSTLSDFVNEQTISANATTVIFKKDSKIITTPKNIDNVAIFSLLQSVSDPRIQSIANLLDNSGNNDTSHVATLNKVQANGLELYIGMAAPLSDFMAQYEALKDRLLVISVIGLCIFIPIALFFAHRLSSRVFNLATNAKRIEDLNFQTSSLKPSHITEFYELEHSFDTMRTSLSHKTDALSLSQDKLNKLVELGIAMSAERDTDRVMALLLSGAQDLSHADGGSLYLIEEKALAFKIVFNTSLGISMGMEPGDEPTLPPVPLYKEDGQENHGNVVAHTVHSRESANIPDAYHSDQFDFSGTKKFDELNGYESHSFLTVPLKPRGGDVIGALQVLNAMDDDGQITPFSEEIQRFIEALAAQAATVIYNRELIDAQEKLMDALIQLIAGAIDAKSPYTGGHCERVPELAMMLAKEAGEREDGIFNGFKFTTDEEWREFSIGAWLHDCGKVVTPEYVVDKSTKLETIYNRIHEVRTRFEVLLRDADVEYYRQLAEGGDKDTLNADLEKRKAQLIDDYAFVAECNVGGEFMADDKIERLEKIAQETWTRNLDLTLGLSQEEGKLFDGSAPVPAQEKLLDDKPYHLIPRERDISKMHEERGFKVPIPENLYNRGEVYNLRVARGTLTEEERFKITEHVTQTIAMLESLPFPPHMKRVPEYAGTHHETLIGTGYPRKLDAEDLSVPSRIMAIADIFEALTASDRPYKKAKTLSESIKILSFFKKDNHIDPELFDLFLTSGIYKTYAEKFLLPDQIDEVDIEPYLTPSKERKTG